MKFFICFLFLLLMSPASFADDTTSHEPVHGAVSSTWDKIPPATGPQIEEAFNVSDQCKGYSITSTSYDCDCVGMTFLELRRAAGDQADAYALTQQAQRKCPNTPAMAGQIYTRCLGWAPMERGSDYDTFCSCYGSEFAKRYKKYPSDNLLVREAQMSEALKACHSNSVNEDLQNKDALVRKMKADGSYNRLFPDTTPAQK